MIISISKTLQDKHIAAAITTPITKYSPLYKSDSDESTGEKKHISKTFISSKSKTIKCLYFTIKCTISILLKI